MELPVWDGDRGVNPTIESGPCFDPNDSFFKGAEFNPGTGAGASCTISYKYAEGGSRYFFDFTMTRTATTTIALSNISARELTAAITAPAQHSGAFAASLAFNDNMSGVAAGDIAVTNGTISGFSGSGSSYNFTVTPNNGANPVTLQLNPGTSTDTLGGNNPRSLLVTVAAPPPPEIDITGNSNPIADGSTTPSATNFTDFGSAVIPAGSVSRTFTIANTGSGLLTLGTNAASLSGTNAADFSVTTQPSTTIAAGATSTVVVLFAPSAAGARDATLSIANDDSNESPYDFAITGTGSTAPEINVTGNSQNIIDGDTTPAVADGTRFASTNIASGATSQTFTIQNTGNATLTTIVASLSNTTDFSITTSPAASVAAGGSTTIVVAFDPVTVGLKTGSISITSNDSDENPYTFAIEGTGTAAPEIDMTGNSVSIVDGDSSPSLADYTDFGTS
ncbi:MAG: choice-of-anchor D domain-containing protein, partial [Alphaproteobacteria bacterium]|nr:choice-of-anchor D domain-containing protein [Alphaproteobacteria bacterium]